MRWIPSQRTRRARPDGELAQNIRCSSRLSRETFESFAPRLCGCVGICAHARGLAPGYLRRHVHPLPVPAPHGHAWALRCLLGLLMPVLADTLCGHWASS